MNFGRDAKAIINDITNVKIRYFSYDVGKPEDYIGSMLGMLRGNENVISYIMPEKGDIKVLLLVTDSGKLLFTNVSTSIRKGMLWDHTDYHYESGYVELLTLHEEETLLREDKKPGFLGETFDSLILYFDDKHLCLELPLKQGNDVYKEILSARKKLLPKKVETPKKASTSKKKEVKEEKAQDDGASAIREIRKMYEDELITKEEMMELLKAQLAK
jgi:hypothetical protein